MLLRTQQGQSKASSLPCHPCQRSKNCRKSISPLERDSLGNNPTSTSLACFLICKKEEGVGCGATRITERFMCDNPWNVVASFFPREHSLTLTEN